MTTTVELATVPSADTPGTCVYVHNDRRSYILGRVAEGTQRAFHSRKLHLGGTENIFLSGPVGADEVGGLLGYLLSVGSAIDGARGHVAGENEGRRQAGRSGIAVHGGHNLCHLLAACRPVIMRQSVRVRPYEQRADPRAAPGAPGMDPDWQDDAVKVWKLPVARACAATPPKRPHDSIGGSGASPKPPSTLSDPDVAAAIVQHVMFSGSHDVSDVLPLTRLRHLKPTGVAVVEDRGRLSLYKGPFAADVGEKLLDPDRKAWLFQPPGSAPRPASPDGDGLAINHHPLPPTCYGQTSMSYIFKCHDRRGKFNAPVAKQLGVDKNDFKRLTLGESVPGKDGTTVTPDMVLGERQPGHGIVVADIPSLDFVDAFMDRPEWRAPELMAHVVSVYWILGPGLAADTRIQAFIQRHPQARHVLCAPDTCPNMITHPGPAQVQIRLRCVDPQRFPLPAYDNAVGFPAPAAGSPVELGRAGLKMQLMPRVVRHDQNVAPFADLVGPAQWRDAGVAEQAEQARARTRDAGFLARVEEVERDLPNRDAEIIALGTGSSLPSKYRNVAGTLLRVPGVGNYLLDCGEGTLGQLRRALGDAETAEVLRGLRCIVVSHLHADHHTGAAAVIKAWYEQALRDGAGTGAATLAVSCIGRYRAMLQELAQVQDLGFHRLRFPNCPWPDRRDVDVATADALAAAAGDGGDTWGLASITRVPVPHCWRSYATQLELTSGLRVAYSGDCRPSPAFARACRGAHLLVHECTFADDRRDDARAKRHSTMAEALGVARDMAARRTLLTHFSQRYAKADSLATAAHDGGDAVVLLAFDMMRVRLGDFQHAACYVPAVQAVMERLAD